jgi:hypothetical protein
MTTLFLFVFFFVAMFFWRGAKVLIASGDAFSQLLAQIIHVPINGEWVSWGLFPNESISGASHRWAVQGHYVGAEKVIDWIFKLFGDKEHCAKAYSYDYYRAKEYIDIVDSSGGPTHEFNPVS